MAIADGVLRQLIERTKSKTLFITHYPIIAASIQRKYPNEVANIHMGYNLDSRFGGKRQITFTYHVKEGISTGMCPMFAARNLDP